MVQINWRNVSPGALPTGNPTAALSQASSSFAQLANIQSNKKLLSLKGRELDQVDAVRQDALDAIQKAEDKRISLLDQESSSADFRKAYFADSGARFDSKSIQDLLAKNDGWNKLSAQEKLAARARVIKDLDGANIRKLPKFLSRYEDLLRKQGKSQAYIDTEQARVTAKQYPSASRAGVDAIIKGLPKTRQVFVPNNGRNSGKPITSKESSRIADDVLSTFNRANDIVNADLNPLDFTPNKANVTDGINSMVRNGITDEGVIFSAIASAMNPNGSVKKSFRAGGGFSKTWNKDALLNEAERLQGVQARTASNGSYKSTDIDNTRAIMALNNAMNPRSPYTDQDLVNRLLGRNASTPGQAAAEKAYVNAGGSKDVTLPPSTVSTGRVAHLGGLNLPDNSNTGNLTLKQQVDVWNGGYNPERPFNQEVSGTPKSAIPEGQFNLLNSLSKFFQGDPNNPGQTRSPIRDILGVPPLPQISEQEALLDTVTPERIVRPINWDSVGVPSLVPLSQRGR